MKKLFFIIGLFFSLSAAAQPTNYTKINMRYRWLSGMFDSALYVPRYNGTPSGVRVNETSVFDGMVAMDTTNNRLYIYSGGGWIGLANYSEIAAYTAGNGLTLSGSQFKLGGTLTEPTTITGDATNKLVLQGYNASNDGYLNIGQDKGFLQFGSGVFPPLYESEIYSGSLELGLRTSGNIYLNAGDIYTIGVPTVSSTTGRKVALIDTATGKVERIDPASLATTSLPISSLTAATGTNTIDNGDYVQSWQWNNLSIKGLYLSSVSTNASASPNEQKLLNVYLAGANANADRKTYSGYFDNRHTGTNSSNIAGYFSATNGTNNYAIIVPSGGGRVGFGTSTPNASALLDIESTTQGAVLPRMNTTQMNAISSPVAGLMVYNSDSTSYCYYNGSAWLKMGSGGAATSPGGSTKQFQYNNAGAFAGSGMLTQETNQILVTGVSDATTIPFAVEAHEDLTAPIIVAAQSGVKKIALHSNGSIEMQEVTDPTAAATGYNRLYAQAGKLYTHNDDGRVAQIVQDLQLKFGAGSGADADTTAFTTTALYGDYYTTDTIKVTSLRIVMQGTSPSVTVKIFYNDSLGVQAGATALVAAGNAVTNTTTGTNITSFDVSTIPPNVYVWAVTSTVGTKPKYLSIQLNGYRK